MDRQTDVIVIGGGLAGLVAAVSLARAGRAVTLLEKASAPGGRAITTRKQGFSLNLGPHALYAGGAGRPVLDALGIPFHGAFPPVSGAYALDGGRLSTLPTGFASMLSTGLLPLAGKLEVARLLATIGGVDPAPLQGTSAAAWIDRTARTPEARRLLAALFRVSTYGADAERMSAGVAVAQLQSAVRANVLYLDGGWQSIVDGLLDAARAAGVALVTGARAERVEVAGGAVTGVRLADGGCLAAGAVVIASSPAAASALAPESAVIAASAAHAVPVKAACLDVALSSLPRPRALFALGMDRPLYLSVHSASAALAPEGGAVVHVMEYLTADRAGDEGALEALLERLQPGFRDLVVERRFLPSLTVCHALDLAERGGLAGRAEVGVPDVAGLYLAGDWVGREGLLADASLASGRRAAEQILARPAQRQAA
jgi:phytoene dehydrogenase-like protein